jgi:group I intron endonuclease
MSKTGCTYEILCTTTGKRYIGQTVQKPHRRFKRHLHNAKANVYNSHLYNAIRKYGDGAFVLSVLVKNVPINLLSKLEIEFIKTYDTYNNGYNSTIGGEGTVGNKLTPEHVQKLKEVHKGNTYGLGWRPNEEQRRRMSDARKGKPLSDATKKKLSIMRTGKKHHNAKKASIFNIDGECIATGVCIREWCRENPEFNQSSLGRTANGKTKYHKGLYAVYDTISYENQE